MNYRYVYLVLIMLSFCATTFAEPVVYVCERPAWDGVKGCGPNNTYYTYRIFVETDDFDHKSPVYELQMSNRCDASRAARWSYNYKVTEETLSFWFKRVPNAPTHGQISSTIKIDRESMRSTMSNVKNSRELNCRQEVGENRRPGTSPSRKNVRVPQDWIDGEPVLQEEKEQKEQ